MLLRSIFPAVLIVSHSTFLSQGDIKGTEVIIFFCRLTVIRKLLDRFSLLDYASSSVQCRRISFEVKGQRFPLA